MPTIKAKVLQITRYGLLVQVRDKKPWFPLGSVRIREGELVRGNLVKLSVPKKLAEKKGVG